MVKAKLKPSLGFVLIEPSEAEKQTASGIVLPESHDEKPQKGKVLAVGADEVLESGKTRKAPCKVGDLVIYKKWGGNEYKVGDKELMFIKFEDIMAIESK
ncbi:MAG TPA: co-chaperone GroES [Clostridia bacterium]|nr:co-chaperone GroES [Clostridia bacterium]